MRAIVGTLLLFGLTVLAAAAQTSASPSCIYDALTAEGRKVVTEGTSSIAQPHEQQQAQVKGREAAVLCAKLPDWSTARASLSANYAVARLHLESIADYLKDQGFDVAADMYKTAATRVSPELRAGLIAGSLSNSQFRTVMERLHETGYPRQGELIEMQTPQALQHAATLVEIETGWAATP